VITNAAKSQNDGPLMWQKASDQKNIDIYKKIPQALLV
jgi:hypothetical protein